MIGKSASGIIDLIPLDVREKWVEDGNYPNQSVFELFYKHAKENPNKNAVMSLKGSVTYAELLDRALRLAKSFLTLGIVEGDVVAYQLPNSWYCCAIDLAAAAIGAVVLPFPQGRGALDMESLITRSAARAVIVAPHYKDLDICDMVESIRPRALGLRFLISTDNAKEPWVNFSTLLKGEPLDENTLPKIHPDSAARILVSSGTEAEPKLVAYSHNALAGGRGRFLENLCRDKNTFRPFYLVPLGSAFGSTATFGVLSWLGASLVIQPAFDAEKTLDAINALKPTHILGVPTMFQRLLSLSNISDLDRSSLVALVSGGAVIDRTTVERCRDVFGCGFISLYGSADGVNCHNSLDDLPDIIFANVGKPNPSICDIKIFDENEHELEQGFVGEIVARGAISPMQYVNAPELDKKYRTAEGWVLTGDLGCIDENGYLVLSGRKKDIIIRGGVNISPIQIEQLATSHSNILSAACVPISDEDLGQRICLCLSLKDGKNKPSLTDVNQYLTEKGLEVNKLPEYLCFYRQLPLNPAGKVNKKLLADELRMLRFNAYLGNVDTAGATEPMTKNGVHYRNV